MFEGDVGLSQELHVPPVPLFLKFELEATGQVC